MDLTIDDFQKVSDRVPFIADLKPSGRYVMEDVHKVGHCSTYLPEWNLHTCASSGSQASIQKCWSGSPRLPRKE